MHGNQGRSQRRGQGAIEDRKKKVEQRTIKAEAIVKVTSDNRAAFEKRAK
jgi:hypothetical protein